MVYNIEVYVPMIANKVYKLLNVKTIGEVWVSLRKNFSKNIKVDVNSVSSIIAVAFLYNDRSKKRKIVFFSVLI